MKARGGMPIDCKLRNGLRTHVGCRQAVANFGIPSLPLAAYCGAARVGMEMEDKSL